MQASASHFQTSAHILADKACQLVSAATTTDPFRILSIGCGNASFNAMVIREVAGKFLNVSIHYIYTDIDEQTCKEAEEMLNMIKNQNVTTETFAMDFGRFQR